MSLTIVKAGSAATVPVCQDRIMGVDPSTYTGIVSLAGDECLYADVIHFEGWVGYKRLQAIADDVLRTVRVVQPAYVFIERPITMGKFNAQIQQQIGTLIRDRLFTEGWGWFDVSPTSLKKWVAGKGHAKKKEMAVAVKAKWQFTHKSDDVIDAYSLARLGQFVVSQGLPTNIKGVRYEDQ